jgi:hypothetical protein
MLKSDYMGIDYGSGQSNIDPKTSIRFGVISSYEVLQAWADSSEPVSGNTCPHCGNEPKSGNDIHNMKRCPTCYKTLFERDWDDDTIGFKIKDGEYFASQSVDDPDIFIEKSPYYTTCQYCSPCAPGAGYIMTTVENGVKAYCFGHDWFEDGKAPYPVYDVKTSQIVEPETKE